jgi:uncharacterized membrane protein
MSFVFYIHLLAACAWVGGSIFLFSMGIFVRNKEVQGDIYRVIGGFFGNFGIFWLVVLIFSGVTLGSYYGFFATLQDAVLVSKLFLAKLLSVGVLVLATVVHVWISVRTNNTERTKSQNYLSRGASLLIFGLNLVIVWLAVRIVALS